MMAGLTQKVKELALANNLDYVGIAPAEALQNEPEGHTPNDFLPGARTVVSLGVKLSLGVQLANRMFHRHSAPRHVIYSYMWYGFGLPSLHYVDRTSQLLARLLEKEGYLAVPVMSASTLDIRSSIAEFSHIHAAAAAGHGELGWGDLVLIPEAGPGTRFGSVITTAELDPDPIYEGLKLCEPDRCRELGDGTPLCARACPTRAIGPSEKLVRIGGRESKVAQIDSWRCTWASMGLSKEAGGLKDIPIPDEVGPDDIFKALNERDPLQSLEVQLISRGDYCGKCIMACPAGYSRKIDVLLKAKS